MRVAVSVVEVALQICYRPTDRMFSSGHSILTVFERAKRKYQYYRIRNSSAQQEQYSRI